MEVVEFGAGRPIVFVHGWRLSGSVEAADIEPAFESVAGWRRIYPDLAGMGRSGPDPKIEDLDGYLDALVELVERLVPGGGFAVGGTSAGAALARGIAHTLSDRLRGVLLRVPMLDPTRRHRLGSDAERDAQYDSEAREPWMPSAFNEEADAKRAELWEPARRIAAAVGFAERIRNDPSRYVLHGDFGATLTVPALIIAGRQDARVGYDDAISVLPQYPRATLAVLDRASHAMPTGDPELFYALLRDWLRRMEEVWNGGTAAEGV